MKFYLCILVSNLRSFLLCICSDIRLEHLSSWYLAFRNIDFWQRIRRCLDIRLWSRFRDLCIPLCTCSGACPHSSCTSPQHRTFKMCLEAFFLIEERNKCAAKYLVHSSCALVQVNAKFNSVAAVPSAALFRVEKHKFVWKIENFREQNTLTFINRFENYA